MHSSIHLQLLINSSNIGKRSAVHAQMRSQFDFNVELLRRICAIWLLAFYDRASIRRNVKRRDQRQECSWIAGSKALMITLLHRLRFYTNP